MSRPSRQHLRSCQRCGQTWSVTQAHGRLPVVCPSCRPAHETELARRRMRQYRQRQQERAEHEAYVLERRVQWQADRLLTEHQEAARLLAELPWDIAGPLVDELKERLRAADEGSPPGTVPPSGPAQ